MPKCLSSSNIVKWTFRESSKISSVTSSAFYFFSCKRRLFSTEADLILVRLIPASLPTSRKSLLRERHCITITKIKTYKRGGGTQVGRMRRKRTRRKEGAPLTNNHSRSITTNDSSVAEDETADAARASRERRAGKSSLVSCRSSASETHETELRHEAGRAADSSRLVCIKQCAQLRCIPAVRSPALSQSPPTPLNNTRQMYHLICQYCPTFVSVSVVRLSSRRVRMTGWLSAQIDDDFYIVTVGALQ